MNQIFTRSGHAPRGCPDAFQGRTRWLHFVKSMLVFTALVLFTANLRAQVANYAFSQASGTYTAITGGTVLGSGTLLDDQNYAAVPLGLTFNYNGTNYTAINVNANGWASFTNIGTGTPGPLTINGNMLAACSRDLQGQTGGALRYQTIGTEFIIQWTNMRLYLGPVGQNLNFQIRLNSTGNTIRFVYGTMTMTTTANSYDVGLNGSLATDFVCRTSTSSWTASTAGVTNAANMSLSPTVFPPSGHTYIWTPPSCSAPGGLAAVLTGGGTGANVSWSAAPGPPSNGYQYAVTTSSTPPGSGTPSAGTSASVGSLSANTTYFLHVRSDCGSSVFSGWSTFSFFTGYCVPSATSVDGTGITNVSFGVGPVVNNPTGAETNNYGNYSTQIGGLIQNQLGTVAITFTTSVYDYNTKIWVDWNNNLSFADVGEEVYTGLSSSVSPNTLNATFTVPLTTVVGANYRMRIGAGDAAAPGPCTTGATYTCFEDYTIQVVAPPSCFTPSALVSSNETLSSATISWTAASPAPTSGYEYFVSTSSTAPTAGTTPTGSVAAGVTTANLSGLSASTTYYYWVRSNCGGSDRSSWAGSSTFFTGYCVPTGTSGFTQITNVTMNNGSTILNNTTGANAGYGNFISLTPTISQFATGIVNFSISQTGGPGVAIYIDWNNDVTFSLSERVYNSAGWVGSTLLNSFTVPAGQALGSYRMRIVADFSNQNPIACPVGINGETEDYTFIVVAPPPCVDPSNLALTALSTTTASISWSAPSPAPSNGYQYFVSTSSTAPTGGTTPTGSVGAGITTASLTGLTPNTLTYVWVRGNCGGAGNSNWVGSLSFITTCNATTVTTGSPVVERFNTSSSTVSCWRANANVFGTAAAPAIFSGTGGIPSTSPQEGDRMVYFNSYSISSIGSQSRLISLPLNTSALASLDVTFFWNHDQGYTTNADGVQLQYSTNGGATWTNTGSFIQRYNATLTGWNEKTVTVGAAGVSSNILIGFLFTSQYGNDCFLDNVTFKSTPTCVSPSNLTASNVTSNSTDIAWTAPSPAPVSGYQWEVRTSGAGGSGLSGLSASGSTAPGVVNASSGAVLLSETAYQIYVRSNCGGSGFSSWVGPIAITTLCGSATPPYSQDFQSVTAGSIPNCTQVIQAGTGNLWNTVSAPGSGFTDMTLQYTWNGANAANTWYFLQALNLSAGTTYRLQYKYGNNSTFYTERLKVAYGASNTPAAMTNTLFDHTAINSSASAVNTVDFTPASTGVYTIGFQAYSAADQFNLFLDDITVTALPACTGSPVASVVQSSAPVVCSGQSFTLTASNTNTGVSGISYQWERSTDGINWTSIAGQTGLTASISQTIQYQYRMLTTCSGSSTASLPVTVNMLSGACACAAYPLFIPNNALDAEITNVTVGSLNNSLNTCTDVTAAGAGSIAGRYANFTSVLSGPQALPGETVNFSLTSGTCGIDQSTFFHIYIDWNSDGDFVDAGELAYNQNAFVGTPHTATGSFIVPLTAVQGNTRMRIVNVAGTGNSLTANYTTQGFGRGEVEDYCFTILSATVCNGSPNSGVAQLNPENVCPGTSINLSATGLTAALGISYQWQSAATSSGPWTNVTGATNSISAIPAPASPTYYQVVTTCNDGTTTWSNNSSATLFSNTCSASITLTDSYGDGWNGATVKLVVNGVDYRTFGPEFTTGYSFGPISFCIPAASTYSLQYVNGGSYPEEVGLNATFTSSPSNNVYSLGAGQGTPGTTLTSGTACPPPCSGTPSAAVIASNVLQICAGSNFTIEALSGLAVGSGISYQWQENTGSGWQNISAATGASITVNQAVATQYRLQTTCSSSGASSVSNAVAVSMNTNACECASYCSSDLSTLGGFWFISNVNFAGLNNSSAGSTGNPVNYTAINAAVVQQGQTYSLSVSQTSFLSNGLYAWFDWNQNESFTDAGEFYVITGNSGSGTYTASINVPLNASTGSVRMRVMALYSAVAQPCITGQFGEAEDYCVTVNPAPACSGTPAPGNTLTSVASACAGVPFNLSLTSLPPNSGYTFQWSSSADNVTWSAISGATNPTLSLTQIAPTYYRCFVTCTASASSGTSNPVLVNMAPTYQCLCSSTATSTADTDIINVTVGTLNNSAACGAIGSAGSSANLYQNYQGVPAPSLSRSGTIPASVTVRGCAGTHYSSFARIFIDYNQDGDFLDAGETVFEPNATASGSPQNQTVSGTFIVPCTAPLGLTAMRVVVRESAVPSSCGSYTYGETEDYLVNITNDLTCTGFPPVSNALASVSDVCPSTSFDLSLDQVYASCEYVFQWQSSVDATNWVNIPGQTNQTATISNQTETLYYRCAITCLTSNRTTNSERTIVNQIPVLACYCPSSPNSDGYGDITGVSLGSISNSSTCLTTASGSGSVNQVYSNYTNLQTDLVKTQNNSMSVSLLSCDAPFFNYITKVWIDYNRDGDLLDANELVYTSPITTLGFTPTALNFNFAVPATALDGVTLMRIVTHETNTAGNVQPCNSLAVNYDFGETEDYAVNITSPVVCNGVPTAGSLPTNVAISTGTSATLTPANLGVELNNVYQWEESDDNGGADPWSNVVGGTGSNSTTYITPALTTTRWYRLKVTCSTTSDFAYSSASQVQVVGGANCANPYIVATLPFSLNFSSSGAGNDLGTQLSACSNSYGSGQDVVFQFTAPSAGLYDISVVNTSNTRFIGWFLKDNLNCSNTTSSLDCAVSTGAYNSAHKVVSIPSAGNYYVVVDYAAPITQSNFFISIRSNPAAPSNDNCATATVVTQTVGTTCSSAQSGTLAGATSSGIPVTCSGGIADDDVWYRFTAISDAAFVDLFTVTNGVVESGANLAWELYSGACGALVPISCGNSSSSRGVSESETIAGLSVGSTYYIRVYDMDPGYGSAFGNHTICIYTPDVPLNNECSGATPLAVSGTCVNTVGLTVAATQSLPAVACNGYTGNADDDVWYTFTLATPSIVNITVQATNTTFDPVVQLFSGQCGSITSVTCADNSLRGGTERIVRNLLPGEYYVRLYHYGTGSGGGGAHTICITNLIASNPPVNDNTCTAITIPVTTDCSSEGPFQARFATRTINMTSSQQTTGNPSDDVWFKFTTNPGQTSVQITVRGTGGFDPVVQLLSMSNCKTETGFVNADNTTGVNGAEEIIYYGLTGSTTYYLRVFDFGVVESNGSFTVCAFNVPSPPNDDISNAEFISQQPTLTCTNLTSGYTVGATGGNITTAPSCGGTLDDNVWYSFIAASTSVTITVSGSQGFDPAIDIRSSSAISTVVQCSNSTTGPNTTESMSVNGLIPGQEYFIQVYSNGSGSAAQGPFSLCVFGNPSPPPNDLACNAILLPNTSPCTQLSGIVTGATQSVPSITPCSGGDAYDVWYKFIAASPQATITVIGGEEGSGGTTDMVVQMFNSCSSTTPIGSCGDVNFNPFSSNYGTENLVVNGLTPGLTYYVRVYAYIDAGGIQPAFPGSSVTNPNFTICYTGVPPVNDNVCGAINVTVSSSLTNVTGTNVGATNQTTLIASPFSSWVNDVWYKCTIPTNGVVAINVEGQTFADTKIRAYTSSNNTCSGSLTLRGADDDQGKGTGSFLYLSGLTPGNTLFFSVDGFSSADFGQFKINVNDGWLWTGASGFAYNGAGVWINQNASESTINPFNTNSITGALGSWSTIPSTTVITIPAVSSTPIFASNATIGGVKFASSVLTQAKITINAGSILTLNGTTFAGTGRGLTGVGAGGRFEGAGRLDIGAAVSGQTVTVNTPIRFRLATTVLGSANVQSNGNMLFDNAASLYSGQSLPNSTVLGNITYRRQGNTSAYVYNFWSSPLTNGTLASLAAPGYVPNLYQYNTASATGLDYLGTQAGWSAQTPSVAMTPGRGYIATGAGLANFTGLPQQAPVSIVAQVGAGGNNFNLLGNPYPAPVSANSFLSANAANISGGAMYIWDDDASAGLNYAAGDFIIYNGLGTLNGPNSGAPFSGNIGACQGFFVNYNTVTGTGSFSFTNAMKTYGTNSEFFDITTANRMRLRMENVNGVGTETLLAFIDDATDGVDNTYDALRLQGNAALSLYTFNGDLEYAIQAWPTLTNERVIDLGAVNTEAGNASISVNLYENFDPTAVVYLEDIELGIFHNLTQDNSYEYVNSGLDGETLRFRLHFRAPIGVSSVMDCSGTESGKILVGNPNTTPVAVELKNANNEVVATAAPFVGEHEFVNLASGNYSLEMSYTDGGTVNRTTAVENNGMTTPASFIASATSVSIADAIIEFQGNAQGATDYTWDFGDGTIVTGDLNPVHAYNALGVYTVTFTAMNNGCGSSATTTVTVGADLTGTNNVASASGFSIFPNPAADAANLLLNLDASETSVIVSINDAAGRLVSTKEINDIRSGAVVGLDVDKLANGVYQVTVEGTNFKNVGRLTIAK